MKEMGWKLLQNAGHAYNFPACDYFLNNIAVYRPVHMLCAHIFLELRFNLPQKFPRGL